MRWRQEWTRRDDQDVLVFLIDGTHKRGRWWKDLVHEDEDRLLGCKLDPFPDNIDELTDS